MSTPNQSLNLTCSVCQKRNVVPRMQNNMLGRDGVSSFCGHCNAVTNQHVEGSQASPPRGAGGAVAEDPALWKELEARLVRHNLTVDDIKNCDGVTRGRLLGTLGFNRTQEADLLAVCEARFDGTTAAFSGATPNGAAAAAAPGNNVNYASPTAYQPQRSQQQQAQQPMSPGGNALLAESTVAGLTFSGGQLIARCSVHPQLPAEFWCCSCNVLVSSRCHVQGIHKDHPFITLRVAAESHVRDVSSWNDRCRTQLNVVSSVMNNLRHAESLMQESVEKEYAALDETVNVIVNDLMRWKEQLRVDIKAQVASQAAGIQHAVGNTEKLLNTYSEALGRSEPLMMNIPPMDKTDATGEDWALRVLDLVSRLKHVNAEAIPMPNVSVPRVTNLATPSTHMELVKCVPSPLGLRLPDMLDPGYFNYPHPAASARVPFTLVTNEETTAKGMLLYNGRTLTRAQDVVPAHHLVMSSQIFYSGVTSWEVHVDRMGSGAGRILAGVTVNGSDGEGVVWDGQRIVGPNEGESRTLDERYAWRPGTVLRFHLELDPPGCFLNCFHDRDGVARIPLPSNGHGWAPAFSVFGPQDQITVVPTSSSQPPPVMPKRSTATAAGDTTVMMERQEHLIASLQQQLHTMSTRIDNDQFKSQQAAEAPQVYASPQAAAAPQYQQQQYQQQQPIAPYQQPVYQQPQAAAAAPAGGIGASALSPQQQKFLNAQMGRASPSPTHPGGMPMSSAASAASGHHTADRPAAAAPPLEAYSSELRQLMRFTDDLHRPSH
jgi:hypothetical protein